MSAVVRLIIHTSLLVLLLWVLPVSAQEATDPLTPDERQWLTEHDGQITFAYDQQFPPFEFSDDDGEFAGLGADYARLIEKKLGVKFRYRTHSNWNVVMEWLRTKTADGITTLTWTPDRAKYLLYTEPHLTVPCGIVVRKENTSVEKLEDLEGRRVAVVSGYAIHEFVENNYGALFDVIAVPNARSGLRDVAFEAVDAFVVNIGLASYYIGQEGLTNLKVAGDAVFAYRFSFAVRNDWPIFRDILQKGLDLITEEERLEIRERWYSVSAGDKRLNLILRIVSFGLLVALAIIGIFTAINKTLKSKVRERTEALEYELEEKNRIAQELYESEERYELVVRGANDGIWDWDISAGRIYFSPRWKEIIGYADDEIESDVNEWLIRIHPDDKEMVQRVNMECRDGKSEQFEVEYRLRHKDGTYRWILGRGTGMRDETGRAYRMAGTHTDITGRKRAADEISRSNRLLRAVLHQAPFAIILAQGHSDSWLITASNREANRVLGLAPEAVGVTGMSHGELVNAESLTFVVFDLDGRQLTPDEFALVKVMQTGTSLEDEEVLIRRADGEEAVVLVSATPVHDENGSLMAGLVIFLDITERKRDEEDRRRLKNMLQAIIDSMPSALVALDAEARVTQWNTEAQRLSGVSSFDAVGRRVDELLPTLEPEMDRIRDAMAQRELQVSPRRSRMTEKGMRYEDLTVYPIQVEGMDGAVIRLDDVTEKARIEEMMVQAEKMLSVGGLAAGMAHEINNPLGIIMQCAESISRRVSPSLKANRRTADELGLDLGVMGLYMEKRGIDGYIEGIRTAGVRAAKIVQNMLNFSRSSDSRVQECNLNTMLDSTIELAANDYDLKKKFDFRQIIIERDYSSDIPETRCSATEIEQVFLNLLKNAAQAMAEMETPPDEPKISIRTRMDGDTAVIEMADNGPGMPETVRRRVFEPFFTTKPVGSGTGLGLSVSYFIICTNHGGQFDVESEPGKGTKFIIRLPLRES